MNKITILTSAAGDGGAATGVGVGTGAGAAVVVGEAAAGARSGVAPQCSVADVAGGGEDAAAHLGAQIELLAGEALGDRATAASAAAQHPAELAGGATIRGGGGGEDGGGKEKDEAGLEEGRHC